MIDILPNLLEALQPDHTVTKFPLPKLSQLASPDGVFTSEAFNLAGLPMPGQWLLTGAPRVFGWQQQKGFGLTGAVLIPIGDELASITFAVKIWTSTDANLYRQLLKTVLRKPAITVPGAPVTAGMGIDHPGLRDIGIDTVVVKSVTPLYNPLVASGGKGAWTATVEFWEYRKPVPAIPKPNQRIPDKAPPTPSANDAVDLETKKLAATFAAKGGALAQSLSGGPKP